MKIRVFIIMSLFILTNMVFAQTPGNIFGLWYNAEKTAKVDIYESDGKYYGKIVWLEKPYEADGKTPVSDSKNKEADLRARPLMGVNVLSGFVLKDGMWKDGKVYDPKNGKTYDSEMKLKGDRLEVRGYIGTPALGRTTVFTKAD